MHNECNESSDKNEIIKATSNFIFESFQLNFIWDFCAKQLDIACKEYRPVDGDKQSKPYILCELYSFILDLTNLVGPDLTGSLSSLCILFAFD